MIELTHDHQLWVNLLAIFGFIFTVFAAGGYILDKQEEKDCKQQDKRDRRRRKHICQRQWEDISNVYSSLGKYYIGMNHVNAICHNCENQKDNKCFCKDMPKRFTDDTGAMADCSGYKKQGKKINKQGVN